MEQLHQREELGLRYPAPRIDRQLYVQQRARRPYIPQRNVPEQLTPQCCKERRCLLHQPAILFGLLSGECKLSALRQHHRGLYMELRRDVGRMAPSPSVRCGTESVRDYEIQGYRPGGVQRYRQLDLSASYQRNHRSYRHILIIQGEYYEIYI